MIYIDPNEAALEKLCEVYGMLLGKLLSQIVTDIIDALDNIKKDPPTPNRGKEPVSQSI